MSWGGYKYWQILSWGSEKNFDRYCHHPMANFDQFCHGVVTNFGSDFLIKNHFSAQKVYAWKFLLGIWTPMWNTLPKIFLLKKKFFLPCGNLKQNFLKIFKIVTTPWQILRFCHGVVTKFVKILSPPHDKICQYLYPTPCEEKNILNWS